MFYYHFIAWRGCKILLIIFMNSIFHVDFVMILLDLPLSHNMLLDLLCIIRKLFEILCTWIYHWKCINYGYLSQYCNSSAPILVYYHSVAFLFQAEFSFLAGIVTLMCQSLSLYALICHKLCQLNFPRQLNIYTITIRYFNYYLFYWDQITLILSQNFDNLFVFFLVIQC